MFSAGTKKGTIFFCLLLQFTLTSGHLRNSPESNVSIHSRLRPKTQELGVIKPGGEENLTEFLHLPGPRVVIRLTKHFQDSGAGGAEALLQLYVALEDAGANVFNEAPGGKPRSQISKMDNMTSFRSRLVAGENKSFAVEGRSSVDDPVERDELPDLVKGYDIFETKAALSVDMQKKYPTVGVKPLTVNNLRPHDVYIVPEVVTCFAATTLVPEGVRVFIYMLGYVEHMLGPDRCGRIGHDHYLATVSNATATLTPYIGEDIKKHAVAFGLAASGDFSASMLKLKENIVLVDDDAGCDGFKPRSKWFEDMSKALGDQGFKTILVHGFTRNQTLGLFKKAKVVLDNRMRGSERMGIEATLHGALLFTDDSGNGQDVTDYPLPSDAIMSSSTFCNVSSIVKIILKAGSEYSERVSAYAPFRKRYIQDIGKTSMAKEAALFLKSLATKPANADFKPLGLPSPSLTKPK